jgi:hypothetical protein
MLKNLALLVIPVETGMILLWIPACAGMTSLSQLHKSIVIIRAYPM